MSSEKVAFRGDNVWHHAWPWVTLNFALATTCAAVAALFGLAEMISPVASIIFTLAPLPLAWVMVVVPRLVLLEDSGELVHVGLMTSRYDLADITGASPGYFGTTFLFKNGGGFTASTISRSNLSAWLGRVSRADKVATRVMAAAARLRNEEPPEPFGGTKSLGDLWSGFWIGTSGL